MELESQENTSFFSNAGNVVLAVLVLVALVLSYFLYQKVTNTETPYAGPTKAKNTAPTPQATETQNNTSPQTTVQLKNLPIPQNNPAVGSVEAVGDNLRYFFVGSIQEVKPLADGTQVTLENSAGLPAMILPKASQPSGITQVSGGSPKIQAVSQTALKPGVYVQVLMYFNSKNKTWFLRDIFIPSEKNK